MNRNLVRKGYGLLALVMALGLAATPAWADGHETELMLGTSGGSVTLVRADDGSYSVGGGTGVASILIGPNGQPLGAVAENGNRYLFAMADGEWMVNFDAPAPVSVTLGTTGQMVSIQVAEDGTYWVGDMELMDGGMVTAENGNHYTLSMMNGMWMAEYSAMTSEVTLGMTGEMKTITVAEDGTYWIDDMELMDGGHVTAENGNTYTLNLHGDHWHADFVMPDPMVVMLGTSGGSVTLQRAEDGSSSVTGLMGVAGYTLGMDGTPHVTASNGNRYTIMMDESGHYMAEFMAPAPVMVALGMSGETVSIQAAEDGSYWLGDMAVSGGETVTSSDGSVYTLSMMDGMWMATFMGDSVEVMLGMHGGMVTVTTAEDGTYWVGDMALTDGGTVAGDGGRMYTLMMGEDGMWTATYVMEDAVTVSLGTAGSVMLQLAEDGSWWHGETAVADGSMVQAENGASYQLMLADGMWSASYQGVQMMIEGTGLTAVMLEDGTGYDVSGAMLPASGMGSIMVGDASYQVWMEDGMLKGARYQTLAWDASTDKYVGDLPNEGNNAVNNPAPQIGFTGDNEDTPQDESRTGLVIDDDTYSMADLLGAGMASNSGTNFVAKAAEEIGKIRVKAAALFEAFSDDDQDNMLRDALDDLWADDLVLNSNGQTEDRSDSTTETGAIQDALVEAFGDGATASLGALPETDEVLDEIDDILAALSSVEGLAEANAEDGMWEGLLGDDSAGDVFDATDEESTVWLGVTGSAHYGAITKKERDTALDDLTYQDGDLLTTPDTTADSGLVGAFAYSTLNDTARSRYVQTSGTAHYEGGTVAVSGTGVGYEGDISVRINFSRSTVDGLVTNLATAEGTPWEYQFADVESISLSPATLRANATWNRDDGPQADSPIPWATQITTAPIAGAGRGGTEHGTFRGELVGGNGADAGSEVVGTWSVGVNDSDGNAEYLMGGFGAVRGEDIPDTRPAVDDGTGIKTKFMAATEPEDGTPATMLEDGMLKVTFGKYRWTARGTTALDGVAVATNYVAVAADDPNTTDVTETDRDEETVEISLASLFANQYSQRATNGDTWVDVAREEIDKIRTQLAALIDSDQDPGGAQALLWQDFQYIVNTKLFYDADSTNELAATDMDGSYKKDEALDVIDDVLEALSGATPLDDALDKNGGGVFTMDDGNPITTAKSPADIWNEKQYQVFTWLGATDYTRFGVWRVRRSRNALRNGGWQNGAAVTDQRDAFAYSPLAAAKIPATNSPAYPTDSMATYEGSTVAWASRTDNRDGIGLEGTIALTVHWGKGAGGTAELTGVGGRVTAVISDLLDPDGDPLVRTTDGMAVRQISFAETVMDVGVNTPLTFTGTPQATLHLADFSTHTDGLGTTEMRGEFVGLSSQGPLAVIGRWGLTGLGLSDPSDTTNTFNREVTILGAFGADLP